MVKGVNFVDIRDAGDPVEIAVRYNEQGADEITFLDITASVEGRDTIRVHTVEKIAEEVFIPLTVGGGIRTVQDIRTMLNAGADKVSINTAAIHNPEFVARIGGTFGSQCIVVAIDASGWTTWRASRAGRSSPMAGAAPPAWTRWPGRCAWPSWCRRNTAHQHGSRRHQNGFDLGVTRAITEAVEIPVIASGGVGNLDHLVDGILRGGADAVLAASIFHFAEQYTVPSQAYMAARGIEVRL